MERIDKTQIDTYVQQLKDNGMSINQAYSEIDIIREIDFLRENNPEDETLKNIIETQIKKIKKRHTLQIDLTSLS